MKKKKLDCKNCINRDKKLCPKNGVNLTSKNIEVCPYNEVVK